MKLLLVEPTTHLYNGSTGICALSNWKNSSKRSFGWSMKASLDTSLIFQFDQLNLMGFPWIPLADPIEDDLT